MITRRKLIFSMGAVALTVPFALSAQQQRKVWRIGVLWEREQSDYIRQLEAFRGGMRALGYAEGKDYAIEQRSANNDHTRLPALAVELLTLKVDLVVTSGALEYVPLADGLNELARVIAPGGHLLHLPIHPSLIGVFLEILFRFKSHPPKEVKDKTERHFRIVHQYRFQRHEAIGWSKTAILAQKV